MLSDTVSLSVNQEKYKPSSTLIHDLAFRQTDALPTEAGNDGHRPCVQEAAPTLPSIVVRLAGRDDAIYAEMITEEMYASALLRGCGISRREPSDIADKICNGKCIIAVANECEWAGFAYLEPYSQNRFVSNSGMIIAPKYRHTGIAWTMKQQIFDLARLLYPRARVFSITSSAAVMRLNSNLGFQPVTYEQITRDPAFWQGCSSCVNHDILVHKHFRNCLCTAMLYIPDDATDSEDDADQEH